MTTLDNKVTELSTELVQAKAAVAGSFTSPPTTPAALTAAVQAVVAQQNAVFATSGGADLIGLIQSGTGAVARKVQDKLRDWVSVKDFGAKGDNTTDDTSAINAAASAARILGAGLIIPYGNYKVSSSVDFSGLFVFGQGNEQSWLRATTAQFDVVITTGKTFLRDFGIHGGWDGVTAGQAGCGVKSFAVAPAFSYNIHLDNLRILNCKQDGVLIDRGGYSSIMRCKINACGLHAVELKGYGAASYTTTIEIGGMSTLSDCPNGYGLYITNGQNISTTGVISENTKGIYCTGSDNRAISIRSYYQENTIGGLFWSTGGSGIGLTIAGCFGGGHTVQYSTNWYNVHFAANSNMTEAAMTVNGRTLTNTGAETTTATTGGIDFTAASITIPPGTWTIYGTMQTVNGSGATISEAAIQITTDNTQSGKNRSTNASFNFASNDLVLNPGTSANLRVNTMLPVFQNTGTVDVTVYLRGYVAISAGTLAYKGALQAIKLS